MSFCPVLATPPVPIIITVNNIDSILVSSYDRTPGTKVTVTCFLPESYRLEGESVLTCQSNGVWDNPIPRCVSRSSSVSEQPINTTVAPNTPTDLTLLPYIIGASLGGVVCLVLAIILCCAGYQWKQRDRKLAYLEKRTMSPDTVMTSVRDYRYHDKIPRESWRSHAPVSTVGSLDPIMMSRDRRLTHIPRPSWFTMLPRQDELESSYIRSQQADYI